MALPPDAALREAAMRFQQFVREQEQLAEQIRTAGVAMRPTMEHLREAAGQAARALREFRRATNWPVTDASAYDFDDSPIEIVKPARRVPEKKIRTIQEAERRSIDLLLEHLNPSQASCYRKNGYFRVRGREATYFVDYYARSYNVAVPTRPGGPFILFCFQPGSYGAYLPNGDRLLGQKLSLEHDEANVWRVAHRTAGGFFQPPEVPRTMQHINGWSRDRIIELISTYHL